jgi:hypothetical protein
MLDKQKRKEHLVNSNSTSRKELLYQEMIQNQHPKRTGIIAKQATLNQGLNMDRKDSFFNINNMNQTVEFDGRFQFDLKSENADNIDPQMN